MKSSRDLRKATEELDDKQMKDENGTALLAALMPNSKRNYDRARRVLPGGTTRVTVKRTPIPIYMECGKAAYLFDVDGKRYLDLVGNYTALIHGHAFPPVIDALKKQLDGGICFANPTISEIELAELLATRVPGIEKIRFANSGTEAVLFAVKAARAFTQRTKIAKLEGAYHGAYDWVEVSEASTPENWGALAPASTPYYRGMPHSVLAETIVLPINDVEASAALIEHNAAELACVIVDVMPSRAGLLTMSPDYLTMLSDIARRHNILLISDEVLNFRYGYHGISAHFGLRPDLITFGKIIGGGLPIGAFGGTEEVMAVFDSSKGYPLVPHGGTFAANPLSMVAGLVSMQHLTQERFEHLQALGEQARRGLEAIGQRRGLPISVCGGGSIFRYHLLPERPVTYRQAWVPPLAARIHREISDRLLLHGVMMPSDTSACCSTVMSTADVHHFLQSFDAVLDEMPDIEVRMHHSLTERHHLRHLES